MFHACQPDFFPESRQQHLESCFVATSRRTWWWCRFFYWNWSETISLSLSHHVMEHVNDPEIPWYWPGLNYLFLGIKIAAHLWSMSSWYVGGIGDDVSRVVQYSLYCCSMKLSVYHEYIWWVWRSFLDGSAWLTHTQSRSSMIFPCSYHSQTTFLFPLYRGAKFNIGDETMVTLGSIWHPVRDRSTCRRDSLTGRCNPIASSLSWCQHPTRNLGPKNAGMLMKP